MFDEDPTSQNEFLGQIKAWWSKCPLFTRTLIYFCSFLMVLTLINSYLPVQLANTPTYTLGDWQFSRILFSPYAFMSVAEMCIAFFSYLPMLSGQEKAWGTVKTVIDFLIKNLEINVFFLISCYTLSEIYSGFLEVSCYGLWNIFFVYLVERCLDNPEGQQMFMCVPIGIQTRLYPVALLVIFSVVSDTVRFDILISGAVGFVHHVFLDKYYNELFNDRKFSAIENHPLLSWIKTFNGFQAYSILNANLMDAPKLSVDEDPSSYSMYGKGIGIDPIKETEMQDYSTVQLDEHMDFDKKELRDD